MSSPYVQASASGIVLTQWARWLLTWHSIGIAYARSLGLRVTILGMRRCWMLGRSTRISSCNMQNIPRSKP